jgi:hypothetical protein
MALTIPGGELEAGAVAIARVLRMPCLAKDASQKQIIVRLIGFGGDGLANLLEGFRIAPPGIKQVGTLGQ